MKSHRCITAKAHKRVALTFGILGLLWQGMFGNSLYGILVAAGCYAVFWLHSLKIAEAQRTH
jgi:hypothetical protein